MYVAPVSIPPSSTHTASGFAYSLAAADSGIPPDADVAARAHRGDPPSSGASFHYATVRLGARRISQGIIIRLGTRTSTRRHALTHIATSSVSDSHCAAMCALPGQVSRSSR